MLCAVAISLIRYYVVTPFYTFMAIRTVPLSRRSLAEVNAARPLDSIDRIPPSSSPASSASSRCSSS